MICDICTGSEKSCLIQQTQEILVENIPTLEVRYESL
jgi:hypothetical protein